MDHTSAPKYHDIDLVFSDRALNFLNDGRRRSDRICFQL